MRPGPGMPLAITLAGGAAAATCSWQQGHAYLGRTCSRMNSDAGTYSSCSLTSSPMRCLSAPHSGHTFCSAGTSCTTRLRRRSLGSGLRPCPFPGLSAGVSCAGAASGSGAVMASANNTSCAGSMRSARGP